MRHSHPDLLPTRPRHRPSQEHPSLQKSGGADEGQQGDGPGAPHCQAWGEEQAVASHRSRREREGGLLSPVLNCGLLTGRGRRSRSQVLPRVLLGVTQECGGGSGRGQEGLRKEDWNCLEDGGMTAQGDRSGTGDRSSASKGAT